jgi:phosphoribosylaminoimidazolecarboxamide formyltransferase/IMP cyclohydrolase
VLASGRGSNLQAIIDAGGRGELDAGVALVISDRRNAESLRRASRHGIEGVYVDPGAFSSGEAHDEHIATLLVDGQVDLVILAGYMRIIGPTILRAFRWRVMNIHPALLPAFPGKEGQRQALEQGVKVSGCTVHFVDGGMDSGPIILQRVVAVGEGDTVGDLADRILAEEHRAYPQAIQLYAEGRLRIVDDRHVEVLPGPDRPTSSPRGVGSDPLPSRAVRRRALLSVYDKTGLVGFARGLVDAGFDLVSSGGTARVIAEAGLPVTAVEDVTGFPEMLDGRVKTLHPAIHGGILARRDVPDHLPQIAAHGILPIDLVCVNLYPFQATVNRLAGGEPGLPTTPEAFAEAIENIDIGGPALIRAAAKNHEAVAIVTDPAQYDEILASLRAGADVSPEVRRRLALTAFRHTAFYDTLIATYLEGIAAEDATCLGGIAAEGAVAASGDAASADAARSDAAPGSAAAIRFPDHLTLAYEKVDDLRYGENPHQTAAFYRHPLRRVLDDLGATLPGAAQLQGKELSYNNIADAEAALRCVEEFRDDSRDRAPQGLGDVFRGLAAAVAVKHMNPCGAALAPDILTAYRRCFESDPVSIFGGIVALNRPVAADLAAELARIFLEVVLAPEFTPEALKILARKPDLRLLVLPVGAERAPLAQLAFETKSIGGGLLVQTPDLIRVGPEGWKEVTARYPTPDELVDLWFAWKTVKHVKSNAITVAKDRQLLGVGAGQMNRVDSVRLAVGHAGDRTRGAVLASDAFFPFPDSVEVAAAAGITAIVQPGGSVKDGEAIKTADAAGMAMVFTGERHFGH